MAKIGIIGGSGLYDIEGLDQKEWVDVNTPFGAASDKFLLARWAGKEIVFLSRHGKGHRISPSRINYRANIYGMKSLGVEKIISVSACGSLKDELKPLDFVLPLQFVDRTNQARKYTFFEDGIVAHISFANPVCIDLAKTVFKAVAHKDVTLHFGGTYLNMEGPQFSTLAESNLYRSWGMDIIGMTNIAEARLAREAELCYTTLAAITDYDCWHPGHSKVTLEMIMNNLKKNVENSKIVLKESISKIDENAVCQCNSSLEHAIVTDRKMIPDSLKERLGIIIGKYIQ